MRINAANSKLNFGNRTFNFKQIFVKKTLLKTIHKIGGFAPFHRMTRGKLLVLMYHRFSREQHPSRISAAEFRAHREYLRKNCSVLSLNEAIE
jgi:hypothetical protein